MHYIKYPIKLLATLISILFHSEPHAHVESWIVVWEKTWQQYLLNLMWHKVGFAKTHTQLDLEQEWIFL